MGKAKAHEEKKKRISLSFREREIRYAISKNARSEANRLSRCCFPSPIYSARILLCLFIIVGSRWFPLSLFPLSLARAQKEERTRESAHMHTHRRRRARARGKPNQIAKSVFLSFTFDSEVKVVCVVHHHLRDRSRQIRTHFPSARALCCFRVPIPCIFFFCVPEKM